MMLTEDLIVVVIPLRENVMSTMNSGGQLISYPVRSSIASPGQPPSRES